jgi:hypothetical protein
MFENTINLKQEGPVVTATAITQTLPQKTIRSSADGTVILTISHQASNENVGFATQRSNVRVSRSYEIEDTGKTVQGYVQFTSSIPKDVMTPTDLLHVANELFSFLLMGVNPAEPVELSAYDSGATLQRLYAGEP